jgi:FAD/FMN-containing dehydrogenase
MVELMVPDELAASFNGVLLRPADAGYDDARAVHNGLVDKRPGLIARCQTVGDVRDAVNLGRDLGVEISVRGGGHNVAGRAVTDGGLMIDLAAMRGVERVQPGDARVRAGHHGRRGVDHRCRRPDAGRGGGLVDGQPRTID